MPDSIDDSVVAQSFMREALSMLDAPEHAKAASYIRRAIAELSSDRPIKSLPFNDTGHERWLSD